MSTAHYPDGEPCRVGDLVRLSKGLCLGRVTACDDEELHISLGLAGDHWGNTTCAAGEAQRLTRTEELAVELLFHLLGRQLGQQIMGNAALHCNAQQVAVGAGYVWELAFAPQNTPGQVQRFRFERRTFNFLSAEEPCSPTPPQEWAAEARCVHADGVCYREGDWLWESGGSVVRTAMLHTIVHPGDEDWQWFYELEAELHQDYTPVITLKTTGLDGRSGGCTCPESYIENEWLGKLSDTERLAIELLFHLLAQHPAAHMPGWDSCRYKVELCAVPGVEYDRSSYWEYQYAQWTLTLSFCSPKEGDARIHAHRSFLFNRERCDFTLQPKDPFLVTGCGLAEHNEN